MEERTRESVRNLTRLVLAELKSQGLATFETEFAAWALTAGVPRVGEQAEVLRPGEQGLDTTLVAGMFFQVLREAAHLPASPPERVSFVRKQAKNFLVTRLAGQISLSRFFRLLNLIEEQVDQYFQGRAWEWTGRPAPPSRGAGLVRPGAAAVRGEELDQALKVLTLSRKGRKLTRERLFAFLKDTGGQEFRVLDLETHLGVNKKTAWSCLNLLLKAGILEHNGEKANRVRYSLAEPFRL